MYYGQLIIKIVPIEFLLIDFKYITMRIIFWNQIKFKFNNEKFYETKITFMFLFLLMQLKRPFYIK